MLLGGRRLLVARASARGEVGDVAPRRASRATPCSRSPTWSLVGSIVAFSAYAWLLQNAPVSKVATYAYVNPVIAIFLGWLILDETITAVTLVGAAIIVASVAVVVRAESRLRSLNGRSKSVDRTICVCVRMTPGRVADALERLLEVRGVARAHVEHGAGLAGDRVGGLDLRVPATASRTSCAAMRPSQ